MATAYFAGLEGDVRVEGNTILVTYYNAPEADKLREHYERLPAKLRSEKIDPRVPWLYGFELDFQVPIVSNKPTPKNRCTRGRRTKVRMQRARSVRRNQTHESALRVDPRSNSHLRQPTPALPDDNASQVTPGNFSPLAGITLMVQPRVTARPRQLAPTQTDRRLAPAYPP